MVRSRFSTTQQTEHPRTQRRWPARLVSIEEYLEYYAHTMVKYRPKFDAVGVVFLRPWWSEYVADDGTAKYFELEPVEAKSSFVRPLYPERRKKKPPACVAPSTETLPFSGTFTEDSTWVQLIQGSKEGDASVLEFQPGLSDPAASERQAGGTQRRVRALFSGGASRSNSDASAASSSATRRALATTEAEPAEHAGGIKREPRETAAEFEVTSESNGRAGRTATGGISERGKLTLRLRKTTVDLTAPKFPASMATTVGRRFQDGMRIAECLRAFAAERLPEPVDAGEAAEWRRRVARLRRALGETPGWTSLKKSGKIDVSTATLDVCLYPPSVLNLDWRRLVDDDNRGPVRVDPGLVAPDYDFRLGSILDDPTRQADGLADLPDRGCGADSIRDKRKRDSEETQRASVARRRRVDAETPPSLALESYSSEPARDDDDAAAAAAPNGHSPEPTTTAEPVDSLLSHLESNLSDRQRRLADSVLCPDGADRDPDVVEEREVDERRLSDSTNNGIGADDQHLDSDKDGFGNDHDGDGDRDLVGDPDVVEEEVEEGRLSESNDDGIGADDQHVDAENDGFSNDHVGPDDLDGDQDLVGDREVDGDDDVVVAEEDVVDGNDDAVVSKEENAVDGDVDLVAEQKVLDGDEDVVLAEEQVEEGRLDDLDDDEADDEKRERVEDDDEVLADAPPLPAPDVELAVDDEPVGEDVPEVVDEAEAASETGPRVEEDEASPPEPETAAPLDDMEDEPVSDEAPRSSVESDGATASGPPGPSLAAEAPPPTQETACASSSRSPPRPAAVSTSALAPANRTPPPVEVPAPVRRYQFTEALPVGHDEGDMSRQAFERLSDHRWPSLEPPAEAPLDPDRGLMYGDDHGAATRAFASTGEAADRAAAAASLTPEAACPPELWLYLTSRGAARRERATEALWQPEPARKSSRVRSTSCRLADSETARPPRQREATAKAQAQRLLQQQQQRVPCADLVQVLAEREVAALLAEIEPLTLACAAAQAAAARRDRDEPVQVRLDRARRARSDRVAAIGLLTRLDAAIDDLLGRDERLERDRKRRASARLAVAQTPVGVAYVDGDEAVADGEEGRLELVAAARRDIEEARHALGELDHLRATWRRARTALYLRACGGVARTLARQRKPARAALASKPKPGTRARAGRDEDGDLRSSTSDDDATGSGRDVRAGAAPTYAWKASVRPRTLAIYDRRYRLHGTKAHCAEQSRRAVAAASVVEAAAAAAPSKLWVERRVPNEYVARAVGLLSYVHDRPYLAELRRRCDELKSDATMLFGEDDDNDTSANKHTWDASVAASAAVLAAVDAVATGEAKNALCAVRPPGHHAGAGLRAQGAPTNGYCVLNHAALGAKYAVHERGLRRVAVLDFDVHHGNGTEDVLARTYDPSFLYISLHAAGEDVFPGTGRDPDRVLEDARQERGEAPVLRRRSSSIIQPCGSANTESAKTPNGLKVVSAHPGVLNLPLEPPPVTTEWLIATALPRVLRELEAFRPDLLILSSGFDAHKRDPVNLGRLEASDYGDLTRSLLAAADRLCCGRVVSVLEGGYGVDCDASGEYVPTSRREAFDSCLRSHLGALVTFGTDADTSALNDAPDSVVKRRRQVPAKTDTPALAAAENALVGGLERRYGLSESFFRKPPADESRPAVEPGLTADNLAHLALGDDPDVDVKMQHFLHNRDDQ